MKKRFFNLGIPAVIMFALAAVLLAGGMAGSARAALNYYSSNYLSDINVQNIGVSLKENDTVVSSRDYTGETADGDTSDTENYGWTTTSGELLTGLVPEGGKFEIGKDYEEKLSVTNSGGIPAYVRVIVYRYWTGEDGDEKLNDLAPGAIDIGFTSDGWVRDDSASTEERSVWYYTQPLAAGETTSDFIDTIGVDSAVNSKVTETDAGATYDYDGKKFNLEVEAEAVQAEYAQDAIRSAWGCTNITITDSGTLVITETDATADSADDSGSTTVSANIAADGSDTDISANIAADNAGISTGSTADDDLA